MKAVNWENSRIRNIVDRTTPFMEISLPESRTIRLYWTKGGVYGPQVLSLIYGFDNVLSDTTSGCGYNKTHAALETCFNELRLAPRGFDRSRELHRYHVGGNFYRVPVRDWLRY